MKKSCIIFLFCLAFSAAAQPCKKVTPGMSLSEVLKLVGKPVEIDTLGYDTQQPDRDGIIVVWQYGEIKKEGNQRIVFEGEKVSYVIADGNKYDSLIEAMSRGEIPSSELQSRIDEINRIACN